jgi:hypothetical protein
VLADGTILILDAPSLYTVAIGRETEGGMIIEFNLSLNLLSSKMSPSESDKNTVDNLYTSLGKDLSSAVPENKCSFNKSWSAELLLPPASYSAIIKSSTSYCDLFIAKYFNILIVSHPFHYTLLLINKFIIKI